MDDAGPDSIGVYMKGDTLTEKIQKVYDLGEDVYWKLAVIPKHRKGLKRLYVATSNQWMGYFDIQHLEYDEDPAGAPGAEVFLGDWHFIPPSITAFGRGSVVFRGFLYFGTVPSQRAIRRGK